jgi:hypothetical protein
MNGIDRRRVLAAILCGGGAAALGAVLASGPLDAALLAPDRDLLQKTDVPTVETQLRPGPRPPMRPPLRRRRRRWVCSWRFGRRACGWRWY